MTRKVVALTCSLWLAFVLAPSFAPAAPPTTDFTNPNEVGSADLVEAPSKFDGSSLTFTGEAIGDAMERGDMAWLHLNDDPYMYANVEEGTPLQGYNSGMPVWVSAELAGMVKTFGDYRYEGDVVEVYGTFNAACPSHGGDMDIHASRLTVVESGHRADDPVHPWKIWLALGLAVTSGIFWVANRRVHARELTGWLKAR